jgi:replicative DNA helicase
MKDRPARPERPASAISASPTGGSEPVWRHISETFDQAIDIMKRRKSGELRSIRTPWKSFNDVGLLGMDWHTMWTICARPGVGKTLVSQQITSNAHRLNPEQDFDVLNFNFEMPGHGLAMRELSSRLKKTTHYLQSADEFHELSEVDLSLAEAHARSTRHRNEFIVDVAQSPTALKKTILDFYGARRKPILMTIDHSLLVPRDATDKDKMDTLFSLGAMITELKRKYPFIFIVLSQLNRSIDEAHRHDKPGSHGNYPNEADVYGSDAMLQFSDVLMAMNRPAKYHLELYGPELFQISDPNLIAFHFMKVRNGSTRISFYRAEYELMTIHESAPPARKARVARGL